MNEGVATLELRHVSSLPMTCQIVSGGLTVLLGRSDSGARGTLLQMADKKKPAIIEKGAVPLAIWNQKGWSGKTTLQSVLAKRSKEETRISAETATDLIAALGLWDFRKTPVSHLQDRYWAELALLAGFFAEPDLLLFDRDFDSLDPFTLTQFLEVCAPHKFWNMAVAGLTHSVQVAAHAHHLIGFCGEECSFSGTPELLMAQTRNDEFEVSSNRFEGVQQMLAPFEIEVESIGEHLCRFTAPTGQGVAAKLLVEGYGDVRLVSCRRPSLEEAIVNLLSKRPSPTKS